MFPPLVRYFRLSDKNLTIIAVSSIFLLQVTVVPARGREGGGSLLFGMGMLMCLFGVCNLGKAKLFGV